MLLDICSISPPTPLRWTRFLFSIFFLFFFSAAAANAARHSVSQSQSQSVIDHSSTSWSTPPPWRLFLASESSGKMDSGNYDPRSKSECSEKISEVLLIKDAFKLFDADFFNDTQMLEIVKGATEFNIPIIRANRKLVASVNGGLHDPSFLIFNPEWGSEQAQHVGKRFNYPSLSGIQRPKNEEDIAFMSVLELGQLIRTKQITSKELTQIFLRRLKRYNHVLEAVVSYTEEFAYKQAKEADELLSQGVYLGMIPFAIGSETAGSITYPAARCGVTALRPTFGTVGRTGVMSISESLDKLGPFCRSAADCTIILDAIRGKDPDDLSSRDISLDDPFLVDITKLTVGYLEDAEMEVVRVLSSKGVNVVPFQLNYTVDSVQGILNFTMDVDMLAHFDEWQRSGKDNDYEAQDQWPLELHRARMIPAVDYVQAQRARGKLIQEVRESFNVDAFIGNATDWEKVCMGNLVGMPVIVVPAGFTEISNPPSSNTRRKTTITTGIYAPPRHDHIALALAMAYQSVTNHHKQRPPINDLGPNDSIPNPPAVAYPPRQLHV